MQTDIGRYISMKNAIKKHHEKESEAKRKAFFQAHPEAREISDAMASSKLELSLCVLRGTGSDAVSKKNEILSKKWDLLLQKLGISEEDFAPQYDCSLCEDTGFENGSICTCLRRMMAEDYRQEYELNRMLQKQNFKSFDLRRFSEEHDIEFKNQAVSQRELMKLNKTRAELFVKKFPHGESLLFVGGTGLGKTYLANCIADAVISKGYPVVYHRYNGLETLLNDQMSFNRSDVTIEKFQLLTAADLLIIDDLYIPRFDNLAAALFEIIDIRQSNEKSTIITTNLSSSEIAANFGDRFYSRLQQYTIYLFLGKDTRAKN